MLRTALLCTAVVLVPSFALSQPPPESPPPTGTGLILGRVIYAGGETPVPGSIVVLSGGPITAPGIRALTDRNGQFVFRRVPKGTYSVVAYKGGHLQGAYGRRRPEGPMQQLELDDGQRAGAIVVPIWKGGSISGTLTDENGDPVVGVQVNIYRRGTARGRRALVVPGVQTTDDRGAFRFWSLTPSVEYIVGIQNTTTVVPRSVADAYSVASLTPNDPNRTRLMSQFMAAGAMPGVMSVNVGNFVQSVGRGPMPPVPLDSPATYVYPTTFYPGVATPAQARGIVVASGQERSGIDLQIRPVPAVKVSGNVIGPDGPAAHLGLTLSMGGTEEGLTDPNAATTISDANGNFTFMGVPAGQYTIRATLQPTTPFDGRSTMTMIQTGGGAMTTGFMTGPDGTRPLPAGPTYWTATPLNVGEKDQADVSVVLQAGGRVSGRIEFEGSAERPDAAQLRRIPIMVAPLERTIAMFIDSTARIEANGQFSTVGLPGGKYLVRVPTAPPGWTLKSVMFEGRDVSDVALTLGGADVKGLVVTFTDRPAELAGTVTLSNGNADANASVLVFPSDNADWGDWPARRIRIVRTSAAGKYKVAAIPPGEYFVLALPDPEVGDWELPGALEQLSRRATQVRIEEGAARTQNLRTSGSGS